MRLSGGHVPGLCFALQKFRIFPQSIAEVHVSSPLCPVFAQFFWIFYKLKKSFCPSGRGEKREAGSHLWVQAYSIWQWWYCRFKVKNDGNSKYASWVSYFSNKLVFRFTFKVFTHAEINRFFVTIYIQYKTVQYIYYWYTTGILLVNWQHFAPIYVDQEEFFKKGFLWYTVPGSKKRCDVGSIQINIV